MKKRRFGMNPDVDTTFLPDRDRDEEVISILYNAAAVLVQKLF